MGTRTLFKINYEKAIETIVWIASNKPGIDIYHVAKILFYADKMHVNKYARPILGDIYIRMPYGPVPSGVRDIITENTWLPPDINEKAANAFVVDKSNNHKLAATRQPNMDFFSASDIECLSESLSKYGSMSFAELKNLTHSEKCYYETDSNDKIDYVLLVDDDNPHKEEIIEHMTEVSQYVQV